MKVVKGECVFPGLPEIYMLKEAVEIGYLYDFIGSPLGGYPGRIPKLNIADQIIREEVSISLLWKILFQFGLPLRVGPEENDQLGR